MLAPKDLGEIRLGFISYNSENGDTHCEEKQQRLLVVMALQVAFGTPWPCVGPPIGSTLGI